MPKKVFVVGSINTDLVISAPYMPNAGETLTGGGFFSAHGGKGANQAVAAARLGADVVMCGCVGDDAFGSEALAALQKEGIDLSFVRTVQGVSTGTAVIVVVNGDNRIILDKGANACLSKEDIDRALERAKEGDVYLTQLENPIEIIGYGLKRAKEKGMFVILNPAPADSGISPYVEYCDLLTPNETEAEILGGKDKLLKMGKTLLTTLGSKGFSIDKNGEYRQYPCLKVQAVDTTAAGDTLCGGLAAKLAAGESLENAALFGSKAASLACTRKGAQPSIPTLLEVEKFKI